jgi:hypothetical protein
MEIKAKLIGTKAWSPVFKKWMTIERGKEELYLASGIIDIFEKRKPKLIKDAKDSKEFNINIDSDSDGADNSDSSLLSV